MDKDFGEEKLWQINRSAKMLLIVAIANNLDGLSNFSAAKHSHYVYGISRCSFIYHPCIWLIIHNAHAIVSLAWLIMKTLLSPMFTWFYTPVITWSYTPVITWSYTPVITAVVLIIQLRNSHSIRKNFICSLSFTIFIFSPSMHTRTVVTACAHYCSCEIGHCHTSMYIRI